MCHLKDRIVDTKAFVTPVLSFCYTSFEEIYYFINLKKLYKIKTLDVNIFLVQCTSD